MFLSIVSGIIVQHRYEVHEDKRQAGQGDLGANYIMNAKRFARMDTYGIGRDPRRPQ